MKFVNLILYAGLIILADINYDFVVYGRDLVITQSENVLPQYYNVRLNIPSKGNKARAAVDIILHILTTTKTIALSATNVHEIVRSYITENSTQHIQSTENSHVLEGLELLRLDFPSYLNPGMHTLTIYYVISLNYMTKEMRCMQDDSSTQDQSKRLLVFNAELGCTREIFPCWDDQKFKAIFRISIKHPKQYKVFSSMPVLAISEEEDDKLLTSFQVTPMISTDSLGILIMDFELKMYRNMHNTTTITLWAEPQLLNTKFALHTTEKIIHILKSFLNDTERVPKIDIVVLSGTFDTIHKWGLIVYRYEHIECNTELEIPKQKRFVEKTIARGIVQQLILNIVPLSSWDHTWLSVGLSTFFEFYALGQLIDDFPKDLFIIKNYMTSVLKIVDSDLLLENIIYSNHAKNITLSFNTLVNRAPFVLRMLQHVMTEEAFQRGFNTYLNKYQFRPSKPDDLWTELERELVATNSIWAHTYELKDVIDGCLVPEDYPVLNATTNYETGIVNIYLTTLHEDSVNWIVPITYTLKNVSNFENTIPLFCLKPFEEKQIYIDTDPNDWIIINLQQIGFYRVYYDLTNWRRIAHYLNHDDHTKIHVLNRVQIIEDAYYFMNAKEITFSLFLSIISYLKREVDYSVWNIMIPILENIWSICSNSRYNKLKIFMSKIWDQLLNDVGYDYNSAYSEIMKEKQELALPWACAFGNTECMKMAATLLKLHLGFLESRNIPRPYSPPERLQSWISWIYRMGMMTADKDSWHYMMDKYMYVGEDVLSYLACSEVEETTIYYLHFLLREPNEFLSFNGRRGKAYSIIVKKHAEKHNVLQYILNYFDEFKSISGLSTKNALINIIENVYSQSRLHEIKQYINSRAFDQNITNDVEVLMHLKLARIKKDDEYFTFEDEII